MKFLSFYVILFTLTTLLYSNDNFWKITLENDTIIDSVYLDKVVDDSLSVISIGNIYFISINQILKIQRKEYTTFSGDGAATGGMYGFLIGAGFINIYNLSHSDPAPSRQIPFMTLVGGTLGGSLGFIFGGLAGGEKEIIYDFSDKSVRYKVEAIKILIQKYN